MIRSLIKLGLLVLACILVYNYFFGTSSEKEQSKQFFGKVRELVVAGADVLKSEKQKFDAGKYDQLLDKLGGAYKAVRQQAHNLDEHVIKRLDELEQRKAKLETELQSIEDNEPGATVAPPTPKKGVKADPKAAEHQAAKAADQQRRKEQLRLELEKLYQDSEQLLKDAQQ